MSPHDLHLSPDLQFAIDRAFSAHQSGYPDIADAFARAAEAVVKAALPEHASDVARSASRKGSGAEIGSRITKGLTAHSAAAVAVVLLLRGARRPVADALREAFEGDPEFAKALSRLCGGAS